MRPPASAEHLIYAHQRCFNSNTPPKHLYNEMHPVDWWWESLVRRDTRVWSLLTDVESALREGDTLVPLIVMSDGTHLFNFAGHMNELPVYMTIGNLFSKFRQMPSTHSVIMVALLPIPIKNHNAPQKWLDEQRQTNGEVLNEVLWWVLRPLTFTHNPCAESGYYKVLSSDGNFRCWKLVLAAWHAECLE